MLQWPWLDREVCLRVALVLWHVAWSGALLSGASLLAARWIARTSRARYALYCGTLAAMALLVPAWGFATSRTSPDRIGREVPATNRAAEVTAGTAASNSAQGDRSHAGGAGRAGAELESGVDSTRAEASARKAPERLAETTTVGAWELAVQGITVAYAAGLLLMLVRLVAGVWGGERLRSAGRPVESPAVLSLLAAQARRLGLKVVPALRTCERVAVPVVVGLLKPVVLIPAAMLTGLSQDQLETVLVHELAHLRRHDHLVLLGQRLIETLLFFHPAVWYLSRQIDVVREECCDDLVLAQGGDAMQYAASLLRVAELRLGERVPPASSLSADGGSPSELRRRIGRLLGIDSAPSMRLTRTGVAALLVALTVTLSLSWLVAAQDAETEPGHAGAIIRFADGVEAELVGVAFHPSENRDWWTGSGSPLGKAPAEKFGGHFSNLTPEQEAQCRELWLEVRGAPVSVQSFVAVEGETQGSIGNMTYDNNRKLYTIRRAGGPIPDKAETTVRVGLSIYDDLPIRLIAPDGTKSVPAATPAEIRRLDDVVEFLRLEASDAEEVELVVKPVGSLRDKAGIEFLAIDSDEREIRSHSSSGYQDANGFRFKVPRDRLARFVYRLRPYTHWATFENVSLAPAHKTNIRSLGRIDRSLSAEKNGRVTNDRTAEPIPGATVFLNVLRESGDRLERVAVHEVVTDAEGRFPIDVLKAYRGDAALTVQWDLQHPDFSLWRASRMDFGNVDSIAQRLDEVFERNMLPKWMKAAAAQSVQELDAILQAKGESLQQTKKRWGDQQIVREWMQAKGAGHEFPFSQQDMQSAWEQRVRNHPVGSSPKSDANRDHGLFVPMWLHEWQTVAEQLGDIRVDAVVKPALAQLRESGGVLTAEMRKGEEWTLLGSAAPASKVHRLGLFNPPESTLRRLRDLPELEDLQILGRQSRAGYDMLARLPNLKHLSLVNSQVVAADLARLAPLSGLQSLTADLNHQLTHDLAWYKAQLPALTPAQAEFLAARTKGASDPALVEKCCYDAFLNDAALSVLKRFPDLQEIRLTNAYLTDAGFREISSHAGLRRVEVGGGLLSEAALATLASCPDLQSVEINWGPWTPAALKSLESLKRLREVRIRYPSVRVSPESLAQLQKALPLADIALNQEPFIPPLEFRLVANAPDSELEPRVPPNWEGQMYRRGDDAATEKETKGFAWFPIGTPLEKSVKTPIMTGEGTSHRALLSDNADQALLADGTWAIQEAKVVGNGKASGWGIQIVLDAAGGEQLRKLTKQHNGAQLAVVVGGKIVMAPTIRSEIGTSIEITGSFSEAETAAFLKTLRRGIRGTDDPDPDPAKSALHGPRPRSVWDILKEEAKIDAPDSTLIHVLSDIEKAYGLPITIDLREMRRLGVSPHTRVSLTASGITMRSALKILLDTDPPLDYAVTTEGIRIPAQDSSGDRALLQTKIVSQRTKAPIPGADVLVEYRDADWRVQRDTALPGGYQAPLAVRRLRTDENGEVPLLLPKICEGRDIAVTRHVAHPDFVILTSSGYRPLQRAMLDQPDELARSFGEIALEEGRLVEGEVLYASGEPAGEVPVYAAREYIDYLGSSPLTLTDARGKFRVRIPAANEKTWIVVLPWASVDRQSELFRLDQPLLKGWPSIGDQPENDFAGVSIPVPPKLPLRPITLSPGVRIQGRVLDGEGRGVPNVAVQGNGGDSVFHGQESPLLMARTDSEGRYTLPPSPSDRTIDVRVRDEGWFGPWQSRGTIVKEAYLPARAAADMAGNESGNRTVDFRPVPSVRLTARCFNGDQPRTSAHLEFYGSPPGRDDTRWRGRFHDVPGQPGTFELIVPRGLTDAALDLWQDGNDRTSSATRVAHAGERKAGERVDVRYPAVERDDDTIEIRSPARSK